MNVQQMTVGLASFFGGTAVLLAVFKGIPAYVKIGGGVLATGAAAVAIAQKHNG